MLYLSLHWEHDENKQKESGLGHILSLLCWVDPRWEMKQIWLKIDYSRIIPRPLIITLGWPFKPSHLNNLDFSPMMASSVTRWLDYFEIFGHLMQQNFAFIIKNVAKVDYKLLPYIKLTRNNSPRLRFLPKWQNLPNLVTLMARSTEQMGHLNY